MTSAGDPRPGARKGIEISRSVFLSSFPELSTSETILSFYGKIFFVIGRHGKESGISQLISLIKFCYTYFPMQGNTYLPLKLLAGNL